ncbi:MAG TPA: hypothetical protein VFN74_20085 [Chloroflexota bacterium]|nr:hypothetical protein [Chloroflexota bacterium]
MTLLYRARLAFILGVLWLLIGPPLVAADSSAGAPEHAPAELTVLATFADAFTAWDLAAAASVFSPDTELYHAFDDRFVVRVRGTTHLQDWLAARAYVHPLGWSVSHPSGISIQLLSARYDDIAAEMTWYAAPLLLDAALAPDGTIARLYVAYSPAGLAHAVEAAATGVHSSPSGTAAISALGTAPHTPPAPAALPAALSTVRVGPERGDYTSVALAAGMLGAALVTQRVARPHRVRAAGRPAPASA